jgi:hypothetical protein
LKTYNKKNFFKHTFCEFQQVDNFEFTEETNYRSKSESTYFYTDKGVYRNSNHWGRVANCRWKLITHGNYKNQQKVTGFAKWIDFFPTNSVEKNFSITIDYSDKTAILKPEKGNAAAYLFTFAEAQQRIKQITHLFKEDKWAAYFHKDIDNLRKELISCFITSDTTLKQIKEKLKSGH